MKNSIFLAALFFIACSLNSIAQPNLPDSARKAIIEREIFSLLSDQDFRAALSKFDEYRRIDGVISPVLLYREAQVAATLSENIRARDALVEYFNVVDQDDQQDEYFNDAVTLYTSVEPLALSEEEERDKRNKELSENINNLRNEEFIEGIQVFLNKKQSTKELLGSRSFVDCEECPLMVEIPSGSFTMGTDEDRPDYDFWNDGNNVPSRRIRINSFDMSVFELSAYEFSLFIEQTNYRPQLELAGLDCSDSLGLSIIGIEGPSTWKSESQGGQYPVTCLTKYDAEAYANWLSEKTGEKYRLPTEAEWEYAARAGTTGPYFTGAGISCEFANFDECEIDDSYSEWPVGTVKPNPFGLYDMLGNLAEYVSDCYHVNYSGAPRNSRSWDTNCSFNRFSGVELDTIRGGHHFSAIDEIFVTYRDAISKDFAEESTFGNGRENKYHSYGIRLVRE